MSLASSPDCLIRSEEHALKLLFPTVEQPAPNSFDDFFDQDLYDTSSGDENTKVGTKEAVTNTLDTDTYNSTNDFWLKNAKISQFELSPPQPWRKGLWCLKQQSGSQLMVEKTRKADAVPQCGISPAHLVANDNFAIRSPRPANLLYDTKNPSLRRFQQVDCYQPFVQQRIKRDTNPSPSPMYSRAVYSRRNDFVDAWQQDFQHFSLNGSNDYLDNFAEGSSTRNSKPGLTVGERFRVEATRAATMHSLSQAMNYNQDALNHTQDFPGIVSANLDAADRNMFSNTPDRVDQTFRFINQDIPAMSDWTATESLHSSNSSHNSHSSHTSSENHHNIAQITHPAQDWWSPLSTTDQKQLAQKLPDSYTQLHQPKPLRATHRVLNSAEIDESGLGVPYPGSDEIGIAIPYYPPGIHPSSATSAHPGHCHKPSYPADLGYYPSFPPQVNDFPEASPFTTPNRQRQMRTPSPSISPTRISSRHRSPSRREPQSAHHRRKSLHKPGPVKPNNTGSETPRRRSTSRSRSRPPRTPKTPKTPSGDNVAGPIGFVNFTPRDADKLLSDVAPSGSSKTRARREQEAREKRKKLSEAALEAVRRAGGDVEALEKAIST